MKYSVITFGCRVNQADSIKIEEDLLAGGGVASAPNEADFVVVNTCSVTASADQGARQTIRRIASANPDARIVVTGCYATRRPAEVGRLPNVAAVVPNDDKLRVGRLTEGIRLQPDFSTASRYGDGEGACGAVIEPGVAGRTVFTLRVQTGCAEPCSYCIIPATRGAPRSVPLREVLQEAERVASAGFKEIALTGVHLGSYGRDLSPRISLHALLAELAHGRPPGVVFRISSLEPMDCTREVVRLVAEHECFAPHFHLPLQHASDRVLAAMRRPYTLEFYDALVRDIRARLPHAAIGSDVIVGFPGETEADFEALTRYLDACPLTHLHVFPYSDRPGTDAAAMPGKVNGAIVRARAQEVRAISGRLAQQFRQQQLHTVQPALTLADGTVAVTGNYLKVRIPTGRARNEWVRVRITGADTAELID